MLAFDNSGAVALPAVAPPTRCATDADRVPDDPQPCVEYLCPESPCLYDIVTEDGDCVNVPINCDDGNPCTLDSCDPAMGCVTMPTDC